MSGIGRGEMGHMEETRPIENSEPLDHISEKRPDLDTSSPKERLGEMRSILEQMAGETEKTPIQKPKGPKEIDRPDLGKDVPERSKEKPIDQIPNTPQGRHEAVASLLDKLAESHDSAEQTDEKKSDVNENGQPIKNKMDGLNREHDVEKELEEKYPESEGYKVISEAYLRDKDGNIVRDPETGEARRIDFVVKEGTTP